MGFLHSRIQENPMLTCILIRRENQHRYRLREAWSGEDVSLKDTDPVLSTDWITFRRLGCAEQKDAERGNSERRIAELSLISQLSHTNSTTCPFYSEERDIAEK